MPLYPNTPEEDAKLKQYNDIMDRLYDDNVKVRIISDPHPSIGRLINGFGSGRATPEDNKNG